MDGIKKQKQKKQTMQKTLGGDRLGSGKKMKVELHNYERSTHDLGYLWRSTMSSGTLVPFLTEIGLPGDTFDINLNCDVKTHPTIGPLFGSYKVQLDVFMCPIRLYQAQLHNNKLGIGMNMASVKLPVMRVTQPVYGPEDPPDLDNSSVNPSSILAYLGLRGVGINQGIEPVQRDFNAVPILAYWDIYKNYYANKQEEIGAVIHSPQVALIDTVTAIRTRMTSISAEEVLPEEPTVGDGSNQLFGPGGKIEIDFVGATPRTDQIMFNLSDGRRISVASIQRGAATIGPAGTLNVVYESNNGLITVINWEMIQVWENQTLPPRVVEFALDDIDEMREMILQTIPASEPFVVNGHGLQPYDFVFGNVTGFQNRLQSQEGLGLKTYQSDLFNNWLQTEWIDGVGGITDVTSIDTSGGSFSIDTLNLSKKVYDMLNRIAVSGGSYEDWLDAVYTHDRFTRLESPVYLGGLIKELVFQEVISNSSSEGQETTQPLGTLAGRGVMSQKHKGGSVIAKIDEPCYILGIISLTPRIDYSQGNKWDIHILTMDDFHKPALDEIGFQELITEQMAWWSTAHDGTNWITQSAGKQPAWINYMTNVNKCYGNFAIEGNEMFMTLNRRYETVSLAGIEDLTTYIDPVKFNQIFAQTSLDAQNFWTQISVDITARRKMSAKIMPNL